jgi:hypothetical protein
MKEMGESYGYVLIVVCPEIRNYMKFKELMIILKKNNPQISEEQVLSTCRHIKLILSEWKLGVQSDILRYLNEDYECEDLKTKK